MTERFIRTDPRGSSSSARRAILHKKAGYIYADSLLRSTSNPLQIGGGPYLSPTQQKKKAPQALAGLFLICYSLTCTRHWSICFLKVCLGLAGRGNIVGSRPFED